MFGLFVVGLDEVVGEGGCLEGFSVVTVCCGRMRMGGAGGVKIKDDIVLEGLTLVLDDRGDVWFGFLCF